jgi:hypothetical protein
MSVQDIKTMQNKIKQHELNLYLRGMSIAMTIKERDAFGGQEAWLEERTEMTFSRPKDCGEIAQIFV